MTTFNAATEEYNMQIPDEKSKCMVMVISKEPYMFKLKIKGNIIDKVMTINY